MKKYINIEDIRITGNTMLDDENNIYVSLSDVRSAVMQTPSANVRENIKAEWIKTRYKKMFMFICSNCRQCISPIETKFCAYCGAVMK